MRRKWIVTSCGGVAALGLGVCLFLSFQGGETAPSPACTQAVKVYDTLAYQANAAYQDNPTGDWMVGPWVDKVVPAMDAVKKLCPGDTQVVLIPGMGSSS